MKKVRLETKGGDFVCIGEIPDFNTWPDVLLWGTRVFQRQTKVERVPTAYVEVFAVTLVSWDE